MNVENLRKLAAHLHSLPEGYPNFDMSVFFNSGQDQRYHDTLEAYLNNPAVHANCECGAVACALGHGPAAGIPVFPWCQTDLVVNWKAYCRAAFGMSFHSAEGGFLFGSYWCRTDNTPKGAAQRIEYLLENGLPSDFDRSNADTYITSLYR